jgi:hypothetical protein
MTRLPRIALASIVALLLVGGIAANHFAAQDRGGSSLTSAAEASAETPAPTTDATETSPPPEPAGSQPTQTATTAPPTPPASAPTAPPQPAQPVAEAPSPQQTAPAQPTGPPSMTACVTIYGQRICEPYHPPSGQYPSGNGTAPNVTQYYPSVSKDPIRNPNIVHPR